MEVEGRDDGHLRAEGVPHPPEECSLGVVVVVGRHRPVERADDPVDRVGACPDPLHQPAGVVLERPRRHDRAGLSAREVRPRDVETLVIGGRRHPARDAVRPRKVSGISLPSWTEKSSREVEPLANVFDSWASPPNRTVASGIGRVCEAGWHNGVDDGYSAVTSNGGSASAGSGVS